MSLNFESCVSRTRSLSIACASSILSKGSLCGSSISSSRRLFFGKRKTDDQKVVIASLIFYIVLYGLLKWGVSALVDFLIRL